MRLSRPTAERGIREERSRRVVISASMGAFQRLVQVGSTLVLMPVLLHVLGPAKFGIWGAAVSLAWLGGLIDIGMGTALVTLVARSTALDRADEARHYIAGALSIGIGLGCLIVLADLTASMAVSSSGWEWPYLIAAFGLAINVPLSASNNIWMALQKGHISGFWELLQTFLTTAGLLSAAMVTTDVHIFVFIVYLSLVLTNGGSLIHLFWRHPSLWPKRLIGSGKVMREVAGQGLLYFLLMVSGGLSFLLDNVMVLWLLGPEASARMTIALRLCVAAMGGLAVVSQPLWPAFTEAAHRADRPWILKALFRSAGLLVALTIVISIPLVLYGEQLLRWWLRSDLGIDTGLLWAVTAWMLAQALLRVPNLLLNAVSVLSFQIAAFAAGTSLALLLKFVLAPYLGVAGILWGTSITVFIIVIPASIWRIRRWALAPIAGPKLSASGIGL